MIKATSTNPTNSSQNAEIMNCAVNFEALTTSFLYFSVFCCHKINPYGRTKYEIQNSDSVFVLRQISFVMVRRSTDFFSSVFRLGVVRYGTPKTNNRILPVPITPDSLHRMSSSFTMKRSAASSYIRVCRLKELRRSEQKLLNFSCRFLLMRNQLHAFFISSPVQNSGFFDLFFVFRISYFVFVRPYGTT